MKSTPRTEILTARVTEADRLRVEIAAQVRGTSRSAYVADAAVERAREELERIGPHLADGVGDDRSDDHEAQG